MKRWVTFFVTLLLTVFPMPAYAEVDLPTGLKAIESEAFAGDSQLRDVSCPQGVELIGSRAFARTELKSFSCFSEATGIASDAFEDIGSPILLVGNASSWIADYALANDYDLRAGTVCRALLIGQCEYPGALKLSGPEKDVARIRDCFEGFDIAERRDLTASEILACIGDVFADAKPEDLSLLYYGGHGSAEDGALIGIDALGSVSPTELRSALDRVPGRKIVVVDACYSGALIGRSSLGVGLGLSSGDVAGSFVCRFISGNGLLSRSLAARGYLVLAAAKADEQSWEATYGGIFTKSLVDSKTFGDANGDGVVTFEEAYVYTKNEVQRIAAAGGEMQTPQRFPEGCDWFGLYR